MPHTPAAAKALRQSRLHRARNLRVLKDFRKKLHDARRAIQQGKNDDATKSLVAATMKAFDRATQKGVVKKNAAARTKSRLQRAFNALKAKGVGVGV